MLGVFPAKNRTITSIQTGQDGLLLDSEAGRYRLTAVEDEIIRVTYTQEEAFSGRKKPGIADASGTGGGAGMEESGGACMAAGGSEGASENPSCGVSWHVKERPDEIEFHTAKVLIRINRATASFTYCDSDGNVLLKERAQDGKELDRFPVYRIAEGGDVTTEKVQTADGEKTVVRAADKVQDGFLYHTRLWLDWKEDEALYGLGQHEEGFVNLRGQMVFVHQGNRKIAVPLLVSNRGYGILTDTYSPMIFSDTAYGSYLYTEADPEMDFYFIRGDRMDDVIRGYRRLTGKAVMLPKWAFGYLQSQERYETQEEILAVAKEYRDRGLGLDGIVLDWCSWPDNMWGQKSFDPQRFPDPRGMTDALHGMDVHFMMSIWPNMSRECENYKEFQDKNLLLPGCDIYNALSEEGQKLYWKQVEEALYANGVDSWWCDSSEPVTPEWNHIGRMEPGQFYHEYCESLMNHLPADRINAFCLYHAKALYEGQRTSLRTEFAGKRVLNLTRSGYTGQQRYGTILWSGDISASWDTMRRQIAAGLNFCAAGLPYWTIDIGAFFVRHGIQWYWDGRYDRTTEDLGYRELFVRWYQWGCFLPVFRAHGTDCRRELWQFGKEGEPFYDALVAMNRLRYELLPYIYSAAGAVWYHDASVIRLLAFDFPQDPKACEIGDQYLFGEALMVCPVTGPMYYEADSVPLSDAEHPKKRRVYLPDGCGWYDYWTNRYYEGGQTIEADAPLERLPLFVKAGSILPIGNPACSAKEAGQTVSFRVYRSDRGTDAAFTLYEDAGDGYDYENGQYTLCRFTYNEAGQRIDCETLHDCEASYPRAEIAGTEIVDK